jgi:uncharacterized protein YeaC (DUF1315 family)
MINHNSSYTDTLCHKGIHVWKVTEDREDVFLRKRIKFRQKHKTEMQHMPITQDGKKYRIQKQRASESQQGDSPQQPRIIF